MGARLLPWSYQYPNLSEDAGRVGGQLQGYKECPFSGVTKSGSVWRKVLEIDAQSVQLPLSGNPAKVLVCLTSELPLPGTQASVIVIP